LRQVEDKIMDIKSFVKFLDEHIKVDKKVNNLGTSVSVVSEKTKVTVNAEIDMSKRYIKYLTKKYLKKHSLREFLYVIATGKTGYQIKYFNIQQEGADE
jgi:large subunit ribosomal protein L22e